MLELDIAFLQDQFRWSRPKAVVITTIGLMFVGAFSALSFGPLADVKWLGRNFFDWLDYLTSNISLPIGGLMVAILVSWLRWDTISTYIPGNGSVKRSPAFYRLLRIGIAIFAPILVLTVMLTSI